MEFARLKMQEAKDAVAGGCEGIDEVRRRDADSWRSRSL
jgi:hypothetical protein